MKKIVVTVPKLHLPGGVSAFWNALLPELTSGKDYIFETLEIGGHGKNLLGPIQDVKNVCRASKTADFMVLNPSLGSRSFFRDGFFAMQAASKKVPFLVFFHGWDLGFEKKVTAKHTAFFRKSFGKAAGILVLSEGFKDKLREWGYKGRIVLETTTIKTSLLDAFSMEEKLADLQRTRNPKLLFLSRLVKEKGIYETLDAFRELRKSHPNVELIIAGDGPEYGPLVENINPMEGITLTGHIAGQEKRQLLNQCHLYCLPSYTEGLPTSVLEAMAFGMPVVTTAVGGLRDFFQDPKMGFFVDLETPNDLAKKLGQLLMDKNRMAQIGQFNHTFAKDHLMAPMVARRFRDHCMESIGASIKNKGKVKP